MKIPRTQSRPSMRDRHWTGLNQRRIFLNVRRRITMKHARVVLGVAFLCLASTAGAQITTFDAPGAQSTFPQQITNNHIVIGLSMDANGVNHGFMRNPNGTFVTIDEPNAGTGSGQGTQAFGINHAGTVVGSYFDSNGASHGFTFSVGGGFLSFDAKQAGTAVGQGTYPLAINMSEKISGVYIDGGGVLHGFVRSRSGAITGFDPAGSVKTSGDTLGIDAAGAISGYYYDSKNEVHGFRRNPSGTINAVDPPNSRGTAAFMIDSAGTICGGFIDANGSHGFL